MKAMEEAKKTSAALQLKNYFCERFKELSEQHPERLEINTIKQSFTKAEQYGFGDDEEKSKFALLQFVLGENFDIEPRNHFVLTESLWHPDMRLAHLIGWVEVQAQRVKNLKG